jgi:eukaryotic-like serine/threonine-protein kinase
MASNSVHPFQSAHLETPLGGRYKIINHLGEGGFGQTFLAEDLHLPGHPRCVVKQLKPQVTDAESLQTARRLFDMEANVLYKLGNHEQIPRLLAHFEDGQEFYLAQEFIAGETLSRELVEGQAWSEANVVALLQDIVQVLTFVHQHQVIHRDIKPSNLIRRQEDGKIVLIDFGAVKQVSTQLINAQTGMTRTIAIGTQGYMPTEQLAGNPHFSSDIYAVGMIGIQALTGIYPSRLGIDLQSGEIDWHNDATHVSSELLEILDRMVRYDFRTRYPTALEALAALQSLPTVATTNYPLPQPVPELSDAYGATVTRPARSSQPSSSVSVSHAPDSVTVTLPHRCSQPISSVSVSKGLEDVTVTLPHQASSSLSPVTPATSPVVTEIGKTAAVTPVLRERSPSRLWLPVFGGTLATIAAVSLGSALLKAQQPIPLANESQNSAASSDQTSSPKATSSALKSSTSDHTPLSPASALFPPSEQPTSTPARVDDQPVRAVKQPQPHPTPIAPPARVDDQPERVVSQPKLDRAPITSPARVDNLPVRAVKQPQSLPAPIAPPDYSSEQPIRVVSQSQPHRLPIAPPDRIVDQPIRGVSQPQSNPQVTGNKPTLKKEAAREQERSTRAVEQQAKKAAKEREREPKETAKEQEREPKEIAEEQERKPQKAIGKREKRKD